jgi:hypothetical protein
MPRNALFRRSQNSVLVGATAMAMPKVRKQLCIRTIKLLYNISHKVAVLAVRKTFEAQRSLQPRNRQKTTRFFSFSERKYRNKAIRARWLPRQDQTTLIVPQDKKEDT